MIKLQKESYRAVKGKIRRRYRRREKETKLKIGPGLTLYGQSCKEDPTEDSERKNKKRRQEKILEYNIKERTGIDVTRIK